MTYQAPEGWRLPPRGAHHAAPLRSTTPLLVHAQRALRLFVTAGTWAAGLCLVIGLVALMAETAGPGRETHVAAAAGASRLDQAHAGNRAGQGGRQHGGRAGQSGGGPGRSVLRTFAGTGNQTTSGFSVAAPGRWILRWSYACPAGTPQGQLIIREGGTDSDGVSVDATGPSGQGSSSTYATSADHYLVVLTSCSWNVTVVGAR